MKTFKVIFFILSMFTFIGTSYGGMDELERVVESKDFWLNYKWGTYDDSELFKSTDWELGGSSLIGEKKTGDTYRTSIKLGDLIFSGIQMSVNVENKTIDYLSVDKYNLSDMEDYQIIKKWCEDKFGEKTRENPEIMSSTWDIGNSIMILRTEKDRSHRDRSVGYNTSLMFFKNNNK